MNQLYDVLARYGFTPNEVLRRMSSLGDNKLINFAGEAADTIRKEHVTHLAPSPFSFIANGGLSGEPHPCQSMQCRMNRVDSTGRFASLYADTVVLGDPFEHALLNESFDLYAKADLIAAIEIIYWLRPAIEAGFVRFSSRQLHLCDKCSATYKKQSQRAQKELLGRIVDSTRGTLEYCSESKRWNIHITGAPSWIEHGGLTCSSARLPPSITRKLRGRKEYSLTKAELKSITAVKRIANNIAFDISVQDRFGQKGYSYLTDRELDFETLSSHKDKGSQAVRTAFLNGLHHTLPRLSNVPIDRLVQLRIREGECFAVYRDAVKGILLQLSNENALTAARIQQAVRDCVEPEINKIKHSIKENRRLLWDSLRSEVIFGAGAVAIGLYTGQIAPQCGAVIAALGGTTFLAQTLVTANKLCKEPDEIRQSNYYFLWKAAEG